MELRAGGPVFRSRNVGGRLDRSQPLADPPDSVIGMTVRIAAIRDMAREPQRRREIAERVSGIRTPEEAVAYIKEVEAKEVEAKEVEAKKVEAKVEHLEPAG